MSTVKLYNGIYKVLANDETVLNYLGLSTSSELIEKALHIQKRKEPQNLADNLPLVCFYAPPGVRGRGNDLVYSTPFIFDVYTNDDVTTALNVAERLKELFDKNILPMEGVTTFEAIVETMHESQSNLENTYCFTVVINFSIEF